MRKPEKGDYTIPKAYRPIALQSRLGKALEAVIATPLGFVIETYSLLPDTHYVGRRGGSAEIAAQALTEQIYES